jgi:hypothetical protein
MVRGFDVGGDVGNGAGFSHTGSWTRSAGGEKTGLRKKGCGENKVDCRWSLASRRRSWTSKARIKQQNVHSP